MRNLRRRASLLGLTAGLLASLLPVAPVAATHIDLVFSTQPGDGLWLDPEDRVRIW